ncbi:MAG: PDZ domain-containing protein [Deltaproteobacteria bacterium]|nr:PDZ domain-containing protein [Deltaproteobacteria bacterium]
MIKKLKLINILFLLAVFPVLALLVKDYMALKYPPQAPPSFKADAVRTPEEPKIQDFSRIVEAPLFPSRVNKLTPIEMIEAGANGAGEGGALSGLKLIGTFDGGDGFAVFEKAGATQQAFKKGEAVFEAGVLKDVRAEGAVIRSGSKEVTFTLPKEAPGGVQAPLPSNQRPKSGLSKRLSESEWVIDQSAVLNSIENMGSVLTDARMTPRISKGAIQGFTVTEIKPGGVFDSIGLKNGDILTRINGYEIDSPEKAMQVLSGLRGATSIELDIVRSGQNKSFHYQIR